MTSKDIAYDIVNNNGECLSTAYSCTDCPIHGQGCENGGSISKVRLAGLWLSKWYNGTKPIEDHSIE